MSWIAFAVIAWIAVGLEVGLKDTLELGSSGIAPSFVLPLAIYIAMSATPLAAQWACLALGLLVDLTWLVAVDPSATVAPPTVIGPHALGYFVACHFVLALRGAVLRRNPLSLVLLSFLGAIFADLIVVAFFTLRWMTGDPIAWSPAHELGVRIASAVYTGFLALPMAWVLMPLSPTFGFPNVVGRHVIRRTT